MFGDTHCHIFSEYFSNIDELIKNCSDNSVKYYINCGTNRENNREILNLIDKYEYMYGALGIHPEEVENYTEQDLIDIENNLSNKKIIAIGEIGLDYHYGKENKEEQQLLFERQLQLAEKYNLPVIIHSRDATLDTINILKKYKVKGTIHSFSGSYETAQIYIKMGFLLGINGVITFKNSNLKDVIKNISLDNIILETDSPYLTPVPFRGKQNNPSHIMDIANFLVDLYQVNLAELSTKTNNNVKKMYFNKEL